MLWIPPGFAHGFLVLSEAAEFLYKTTDYWYPEHERTLLWNDPALGIAWPLTDRADARRQGRRRACRSRQADATRSPRGACADDPAHRRRRASSASSLRARCPPHGERRRAAIAPRSTSPMPTRSRARARRRDRRSIVNAAAYTAVDRAESEPELRASRSTRARPRSSPTKRKRIDAVLIHYSTDYVFDGASDEALRRRAPPNPLNVYGASKLAASARSCRGAHGADPAHELDLRAARPEFSDHDAPLAAERDELRIVADQFGVPNWSRTLAEATATLVGRGARLPRRARGLYHLSGAGHGELVRVRAGDLRRRGSSARRADHDRGISDAARRPAYARARYDGDSRRTFGFALPHWRDAAATIACAVGRGAAADSAIDRSVR